MDSLVSTEWLAEHLAAPDLAVLDASSHLPAAGRDARAEFAAAHIPQARFLDLASLVDPGSDVPAAVPTGHQLEERLAALGIARGQRIVVYDDSDVRTAARAWFILRLRGKAEVAILDGGLGKWRAEGRAVEPGAAAALSSLSPGRAAAEPALTAVRTKADLLANLATGAEQVVDARDPGRFTGELPDFRPEVAPGHIPGSRNLPFGQVLDEDGTYKRPDALRAVFATAGIDLARPVVTTCGGGVTAAVLLFALHLAGTDEVALYDGSWADWGHDPATPKALGPV